jgi:4-hydroxybenzoate polyprenyltransferase
MDTVKQIAQFVRWRDWGPGKLTLFWGLSLYIGVVYEFPFDGFLMTFVAFLIFAATQSTLGYVLNDWSDRELDRRQFKRNSFNGKSQLESILALTLVMVTAFIAGLPLALRPGFGLLWFAWAATAASYSLEPLRLKTRGLVGLLVSVVAQWFLPALMTFAAFQVVGGLDMWLLVAAFTINGTTQEVARQRAERARTLHTRTGTFAASLSAEKVNLIYAVALLFDKMAIGTVIAVVVANLSSLGPSWSLHLAVLVAGIYTALFLATLGRTFNNLRGAELEDPYYQHPAARWSVAQLLHGQVHTFVLPILLAITATTRTPIYGVMLGLFFGWMVMCSSGSWRMTLKAVRIRSGK